MMMKLQHTTMLVGLFLSSMAASPAQTVLTAWNFDNLAVGLNSSPAPSAGIGSAAALGMDNSDNHTNSISNPDVQSLAGSSSGGAHSWRVRGYSGVSGNRGNGWSTNAPLATQGAQFEVSTFGFYRIQVSFDVYATPDAEANLLVQYSTDGSHWNNASISGVGTLGTVVTNTVSADTASGTYVHLASGWNNQIIVNLSGLSGVDNDPQFAFRVVNASTGADCVDTSGAVYNNTSGSWTFDNVSITGTSIDTIADWTFDNYKASKTIVLHPLPVIGDGTASSIGFDNAYTYADGTVGSTNGPDITDGGGISSSGALGPNVWRVRGNPGANGWNTAAPLVTQGAQFDVSTAGYSNIVCSFDVYFTSAAEAKMCVVYTTDAWASTNSAQTLFIGSYPNFIQTNPPTGSGGSPNTVTGTYFYNSLGQGFYNNFVVDFTGIAGADDNPQFGFRIVNAAMNGDCVAFNGGSYNNSSGNWRYDNVVVGGTAGQLAPAIAFDPNASVDRPFTNTFTEDSVWRSKIAAIYVNGSVLTNSAYTTDTAGMIVFTPSASPLLQSSGDKNIVIIATGYGTGKVTQPLAAGVAVRLAILTQPEGPSASGGTLIANPVLGILDQYGNGTTNPYANVSVTASAGGSAGWSLGGDTAQMSANGIVAFTNLTASVSGSSAVSNAVLTFSLTGYAPTPVTNSLPFQVDAPPVPFTPGNLAVLQLDQAANNTTFSIIEIKPSLAGQTAPVNVVPISATGTNGLRLSSSGACGKLSLSDDGTLICFAAFADGSAATPDETFNYNRAGAGLDYSGQLVMGLSYVSTSPNGSQARSCTTLGNNHTWIVDDKGGLYSGSTENGVLASPNLNAYNNVVVRVFGGVPYVETQKTANGQVIPVVYALGFDAETGLYDVTRANNLTTDPDATDFYLVSSGGSSNLLYILDGISPTEGIIKKYSWVAGADPNNPEGQYGWAANGVFTNGTGGDSLFATTNGAGGVYLYLTTADVTNNSVVRFTDASGWNVDLQIVASNVLYTATGNTYLKGLTFVPLQTNNVAELTPPPILTAQPAVTVGQSFSITCTPDDPAWRAAITGIMVNGSTLPAAAYAATQSGEITFDASQSALLSATGAKQIVISARGYSDAPVIQSIMTQRFMLGALSVAGGQSTFAFTSATGQSFSVLGTNDLSAPVNTWPVIGPALETPGGSGHYQFSDPDPATNSSRFYILRQP